MFNMPLTIYKTDGTVRFFSYDFQGNRIRKNNGSVDFNYVRGADGREEAIVPNYGTTPVYNVYGNDLTGKIKRSGRRLTRFYYVKDHLGSVRATVDAGGNVASYDDYYPFGMSMNGRSGNNGQSDARYKFTGKERDNDITGYDYFGARYYDSRIGKFFSVDPLTMKVPHVSPYHYSLNNPMRFVDPTGMEAVEIGDTDWESSDDCGPGDDPSDDRNSSQKVRRTRNGKVFFVRAGPDYALTKKGENSTAGMAFLGETGQSILFKTDGPSNGLISGYTIIEFGVQAGSLGDFADDQVPGHGANTVTLTVGEGFTSFSFIMAPSHQEGDFDVLQGGMSSKIIGLSFALGISTPGFSMSATNSAVTSPAVPLAANLALVKTMLTIVGIF